MSLYRIATANAYDRTVDTLSRRQSELVRTQEQLSSGKRVMRASDDAVAATLAERAQNRLARVEADQKALDASRTALTQVESGLGEANDVLHQVRELVVQAGNPALSASEREDIARQIEGLREQMLAVANRTDTAGQTLYGGLGGALKPFVDLYGPTPGVSFQGQSGQYAATEGSLPRAIDGSAIWQNVTRGNGYFTVELDTGNQGLIRTDMGLVDGSPVPAALDTTQAAPNGLGYQITFGGTREAPTFTIEQVTARDPVTNLPTTTTPLVPPVANEPYQDGKALTFDGNVRITLTGDPMGVGNPNVAPQPSDPVPQNTVTITPVAQATDIFQTLQNTVDALRYGGSNQPAHLTQELARSLTEIDAGTNNILNARGRVGDWLNRADTMGDVLADKAVFHESEKSAQEDLDLVKGISDFKNQEVALQAALQSYAQVQRLSLFQYIA